jgi:hypothetical protein
MGIYHEKGKENYNAAQSLLKAVQPETGRRYYNAAASRFFYSAYLIMKGYFGEEVLNKCWTRIREIQSYNRNRKCKELGIGEHVVMTKLIKKKIRGDEWKNYKIMLDNRVAADYYGYNLNQNQVAISAKLAEHFMEKYYGAHFPKQD